MQYFMDHKYVFRKIIIQMINFNDPHFHLELLPRKKKYTDTRICRERCQPSWWHAANGSKDSLSLYYTITMFPFQSISTLHFHHTGHLGLKSKNPDQEKNTNAHFWWERKSLWCLTITSTNHKHPSREKKQVKWYLHIRIGPKKVPVCNLHPFCRRGKLSMLLRRITKQDCSCAFVDMLSEKMTFTERLWEASLDALLLLVRQVVHGGGGARCCSLMNNTRSRHLAALTWMWLSYLLPFLTLVLYRSRQYPSKWIIREMHKPIASHPR